MVYKIGDTAVIDNSRNVTTGMVTVTATTDFVSPNGNTAGRPGSPTTGQMYFDTTLDKLLTYNGTEWK
tara:strand:- start:14367 stop:14570 length:204 start_codon:yes stop_codon:yes gene_type:complete